MNQDTPGRGLELRRHLLALNVRTARAGFNRRALAQAIRNARRSHTSPRAFTWQLVGIARIGLPGLAVLRFIRGE